MSHAMPPPQGKHVQWHSHLERVYCIPNDNKGVSVREIRRRRNSTPVPITRKRKREQIDDDEERKIKRGRADFSIAANDVSHASPTQDDWDDELSLDSDFEDEVLLGLEFSEDDDAPPEPVMENDADEDGIIPMDWEPDVTHLANILCSIAEEEDEDDAEEDSEDIISEEPFSVGSPDATGEEEESIISETTSLEVVPAPVRPRRTRRPSVLTRRSQRLAEQQLGSSVTTSVPAPSHPNRTRRHSVATRRSQRLAEQHLGSGFTSSGRRFSKRLAAKA